MTYFNDKQKVHEYIKMCEGTEAKELINILLNISISKKSIVFGSA